MNSSGRFPTLRAWLHRAAAPFVVSDASFARMRNAVSIDSRLPRRADALLTAVAVLGAIAAIAFDVVVHTEFYVLLSMFVWPIWMQIRLSGPVWRSGMPQLRHDLAMSITPVGDALPQFLKPVLVRSMLPITVVFTWGQLLLLREIFSPLLFGFSGTPRWEMFFAQSYFAIGILPSLLSTAGLAHLIGARTRLKGRVSFTVLQICWTAISLIVPAVIGAIVFTSGWGGRSLLAEIVPVLFLIAAVIALSAYLLTRCISTRLGSGFEFSPALKRALVLGGLSLSVAAMLATGCSILLLITTGTANLFESTVESSLLLMVTRTAGIILLTAATIIALFQRFRAQITSGHGLVLYFSGLGFYVIAAAPSLFPDSARDASHLQAFLLADAVAVALIVVLWRRSCRLYYRFD